MLVGSYFSKIKEFIRFDPTFQIFLHLGNFFLKKILRLTIVRPCPINNNKAINLTRYSNLVMKIPTKVYFSFLFFVILSESNFLAKAQTNMTIPVNVGVILDFDTCTGKMGLSCINMALSDFYASNSHYKTRLFLHSRDSKGDVIDAAAAGKSPSTH